MNKKKNIVVIGAGKSFFEIDPILKSLKSQYNLKCIDIIKNIIKKFWVFQLK